MKVGSINNDNCGVTFDRGYQMSVGSYFFRGNSTSVGVSTCPGKTLYLLALSWASKVGCVCYGSGYRYLSKNHYMGLLIKLNSRADSTGKDHFPASPPPPHIFRPGMGSDAQGGVETSHCDTLTWVRQKD